VIVFLDTSALVKLYLVEDGSEALRAHLENTIVAVSPLTFGEVYATFARRLREGLLTPGECDILGEAFEEDWITLLQIPFSREVLAQVPGLCRRHPLRGADAMQLACALLLHQEEVEVLFGTSDRQLLAAARAEGVAVLDPADSSGFNQA
jgi:predicted nucleic acid-binding protein